MGNYNYIATAIIDGALAHGTSTSDLIESSGSIEAAVDAIVDFYTESGAEEFENVHGEPMGFADCEFRQYVEHGLTL